MKRISTLCMSLGLACVLAAASIAAGPKRASYTRNVTSQDLARAGSAAPHGTWTLKVKADGLSLAARGQGLVSERAAWSMSTVAIADTPGAISIFCGSNVKGTYRWTLRKSTLTFKLVKDACNDRAGVLSGRWKR